ncbi:MAG: hypothetical protein ACD_63C00104G0005 [uncultured bacterium]|nr:MAG: hypothetical protein ACD_63C00104G0005 [uncultured bacterium]
MFPNPQNRKRLIGVIILTIVLAFVLGIAGTFLTNFYIFPRMAADPIFEKILEMDEFGRTIFKVVESEKVTIEEDEAVLEAIEKTKPSVVSIVLDNGKEFDQKNIGAGIVVAADGLILTNKSLFTDVSSKYEVVLRDGAVYEVKAKLYDPLCDLAFLKIDADNLAVAHIGSVESLKEGQTLIAVSNVFERYENPVNLGVVNAVNREIKAFRKFDDISRIEGVIETNAVINGVGGAPIVNIKGEIVGISTKLADTKGNMGFAIPIDAAKSALNSYIKNGRIVRSTLGVRYVGITKDFAKLNNLPEQGAFITSLGNPELSSVIPGSPADKANFREGDVIVRINERYIDREHGLMSVLQNYKPGDEIEVGYIRDWKDRNVKVELGESG